MKMKKAYAAVEKAEHSKSAKVSKEAQKKEAKMLEKDRMMKVKKKK
jgi:hypothetical protein